jgi:hypothetical protein
MRAPLLFCSARLSIKPWQQGGSRDDAPALSGRFVRLRGYPLVRYDVAAAHLARTVRGKRRGVIGLATGGTEPLAAHSYRRFIALRMSRSVVRSGRNLAIAAAATASRPTK